MASAFLSSLFSRKSSSDGKSISSTTTIPSVVAKARLATTMKAQCGPPIAATEKLQVYQLPLQEFMKNSELRIAKCELEVNSSTGWQFPKTVVKFANKLKSTFSYSTAPAVEASPKVLMVVGATGAGKTTLINGMVNYVLGVDWEDAFRFKLISETKTRSEAYSQTSWITAYSLPNLDGSPFPYPLIIVDTPGFGDTDGVERDKEIVAQIKEFFSLPPPNGIDHIDAIGFVAQSSLARLTKSQKYIFSSILAIFGKDIEKNIFLMTTFADGGKATVLESVKEAGIPYVDTFKFNNSALFEKSENEFDKLFWTMGIKSFQAALTRFQEVEPRSLQLTREVLKEREHLEVIVQGLHQKIQIAMGKISELQQEQEIMKKHEAAIKDNKNFTYTVDVVKMNKIKLDHGIYVTNCINCNITCHYPCSIPRDQDKRGCAAMSPNGKCAKCQCNCVWSDHVNNGYRIEMEIVPEKRTYDNLKLRYHEAKSGMSASANIVKKMEEELRVLHDAVLSMVQEARKVLNRLKEIALKPDPLSEVDYIDILIESEKQEGAPGWQQRMQCLQKIRKKAQLLVTVGKAETAVGEYSSDWWKNFHI